MSHLSGRISLRGDCWAFARPIFPKYKVFENYNQKSHFQIRLKFSRHFVFVMSYQSSPHSSADRYQNSPRFINFVFLFKMSLFCRFSNTVSYKNHLYQPSFLDWSFRCRRVHRSCPKKDFVSWIHFLRVSKFKLFFLMHCKIISWFMKGWRLLSNYVIDWVAKVYMYFETQSKSKNL